MRVLGAGAAMLVVVSLSGCFAQQDPDVTPPPSPSSTPVFATEEEALAAATEAYANYLEVSDAILADGGANPERLLDVATPEVLEQEKVGFDQIAADGYHAVGSSKFDTVTLQRSALDVTQLPSVSVYLCSDVSNVDIVDADGDSVIEGDGGARTPFQIDFVGVDSRLIVSQSALWTGSNFC